MKRLRSAFQQTLHQLYITAGTASPIYCLFRTVMLRCSTLPNRRSSVCIHRQGQSPYHLLLLHSKAQLAIASVAQHHDLLSAAGCQSSRACRDLHTKGLALAESAWYHCWHCIRYLRRCLAGVDSVRAAFAYCSSLLLKPAAKHGNASTCPHLLNMPEQQHCSCIAHISLAFCRQDKGSNCFGELHYGCHPHNSV